MASMPDKYLSAIPGYADRQIAELRIMIDQYQAKIVLYERVCHAFEILLRPAQVSPERETHILNDGRKALEEIRQPRSCQTQEQTP
jgi:hypothetical protein